MNQISQQHSTRTPATMDHSAQAPPADILRAEANYHDQVARKVVVDKALVNRLRSATHPEEWICPLSGRLKKDFAALLSPVKGKKVLVYGCGTDDAPGFFACRGAQVTAIDISPVSVAVQAKILAQLGSSSCEARVSDAQHTPFPDSSFDLIYGNAILHHLDTESAAREIFRLLKPGGTVIFREVQLGGSFLRLFRLLTPNARTRDEHPLVEADYRIYRAIFHGLSVSTYVLSAIPFAGAHRLYNTLAAKLGLWRMAEPKGLYRKCDSLDHLLLRNFPSLQKKAWLCLMYAQKQP
jgi:SAM-dependent methyltransferase